MDYEKKYNEAIERMKSWARGEHPECFSEAQKAAEFVFPELAKSEDDKIREMLIDSFTRADMGGEIYGKGVTYKQVIAWLEKQVSPDMVADAYLRGCNDTEKKWLEKQGELTQSVTKISEQEQKLNECKDALEASVEYRKFREDCGIKGPVMLDEIEEAYYNGATSIQKPAWSEEDEEELGIAIKYLQQAGQWDSATWLKSLKERLVGCEHDNVTSKMPNVGNSSITVEAMYNPTKDASV